MYLLQGLSPDMCFRWTFGPAYSWTKLPLDLYKCQSCLIQRSGHISDKMIMFPAHFREMLSNLKVDRDVVIFW